jgi:DNA polymerase-3 subunit delta'
MSFRDIKDQDVPVRLLQNMLRRNRIPNGLLFWGPSGVGKRMTAIEMARAINCREHVDDGCGACLPCRKVASGNHPDVKIVMPVKRSRVIDVETIEGVNEFASLRAFESKWRVFVLLDADRMHVAAQNKFLKTLEEPPGKSVFILVTEFPRMLLPTIRSRCQQVRFGALRPETVADLLTRDRDLPRDLAMSIAELSQGQMSRALDLVDSEKRAAVLDVVHRLAAGADPLALAEEFSQHLAARQEQIALDVKTDANDEIVEDFSREDRDRVKAEEEARVDAVYRRDLMEYLYLLETWYRDVAVCRLLGEDGPILNRDKLAELRAAPDIVLDDKIAAIQKACLYIERFIREDRVFRVLFFALA